MSTFADRWLKKPIPGKEGVATLATPATPRPVYGRDAAGVAEVAGVARGPASEKGPSVPAPLTPPSAGHTPELHRPLNLLVQTGQPDDALAWRRTYFAECDRLMLRDGITLAQARPKAFERVLHSWHQRHAWPGSEYCAGCGGDLAGGQSIHEFPTGESVHLTDDLACWIEFVRRWRAAAVAGLAELGIEVPEGWEP